MHAPTSGSSAAVSVLKADHTGRREVTCGECKSCVRASLVGHCCTGLECIVPQNLENTQEKWGKKKEKLRNTKLISNPSIVCLEVTSPG